MSSACFVFNKTHIFDCSHFIDTLNVCNDVNYVSATHDTRKVFPSIRNSISIPRHVTFLKNDNIDKSHPPLTNLLSFSETKSSPSSFTSDLNFSECALSLHEISSSQMFHHVSSSVKFSLFFMILFWGIVNLFSCDSWKIYLTSTFTKTLFFICLRLFITTLYLFINFSHSYGCWNVAKVEIFIMFYIHVIWSFIFVIYVIFTLCFIFITYLYVYYMFLNLFYISIFTLFDFKFMW